MREEVTIVTCDKCGMEITIESTIESTVDYQLGNRGWLVTTEDDLCSDCAEEELLEVAR